jgi:hypothetical protein
MEQTLCQLLGDSRMGESGRYFKLLVIRRATAIYGVGCG